MRRELIENLLATTPYDEVEFDSPAYKWLKAVVELLNDARSCTEANDDDARDAARWRAIEWRWGSGTVTLDCDEKGFFRIQVEHAEAADEYVTGEDPADVLNKLMKFDSEHTEEAALPSAEARRIDYGSMWGFMRSVLTQGAAIYQDFAAGNLKDYEEYSARVDAAARERDDELKSLPSATAPSAELCGTPRTDAAKRYSAFNDEWFVPVAVAEQLERELAEAKEHAEYEQNRADGAVEELKSALSATRQMIPHDKLVSGRYYWWKGDEHMPWQPVFVRPGEHTQIFGTHANAWYHLFGEFLEISAPDSASSTGGQK